MNLLSEIEKELKHKGVTKKITENTKFNDLGLDSIDLVYLITKIEEKLDVMLSNDQLSKIKTVKDLISQINTLIANK